MLRYTLCAILLAVGCGDNIHPAPPPDLGTLPDPGSELPDPVTPDTPPDACVVDAPVDADDIPRWDVINVPRCCVGMLNGNPPLECGPAPGRCAWFLCYGQELLVCRR